MVIFLLKILVILSCAGLYFWGGFSWHNARRYIMPLLLSLSCLLFSHSLWALTMLVSSPLLTIGYGEKSIFRHIFGDAWARFVYLSIVATVLSIWMIFILHTNILLILTYIGLCGTLGITLRKFNQWLGDPIFGAALATIVFLT